MLLDKINKGGNFRFETMGYEARDDHILLTCKTPFYNDGDLCISLYFTTDNFSLKLDKQFVNCIWVTLFLFVCLNLRQCMRSINFRQIPPSALSVLFFFLPQNLPSGFKQIVLKVFQDGPCSCHIIHKK